MVNLLHKDYSKDYTRRKDEKTTVHFNSNNMFFIYD